MDMLRLTVLDEGYQVDISPAYFQHQTPRKQLKSRPWCFNLLGVASPPRKKINTSNVAMSTKPSINSCIKEETTFYAGVYNLANSAGF